LKVLALVGFEVGIEDEEKGCEKDYQEKQATVF
jgi:hypothetical protein